MIYFFSKAKKIIVKSILFRSLLFLVISSFITSYSTANIIGSDLQNFVPITSGLDFVTVQSANTLEPGVVNLGSFINYAVNTLPYFSVTSTSQKTNFKDSLLGLDLNLGVGLMKGWDIGISMPSVISQSVWSDQAHGEFESVGITEVRPNTKIRLLGDAETGLASVLSMNIPLIQNSPFTGANPSPIYNIELAAHTSIEKVVIGANIGYRIRTPGTPIKSQGIVPFGDQYIGSLAASYLISSIDTKIIAEIFGASPVKSIDFNTDRYSSSLEALLGLKHDFTSELSLHTGVGFGLIAGNADPDWRVYAGLNFSFGPLFSKKPVAQVENKAPVQVQPDIEENTKQALTELDDPFAGAPQAPVETFVVKDILFAFNSDQLEPESQETLNKLAVYLNKPPAFRKLIISGHTDSVGKPQYNLSLSERRAQAVRTYLINKQHLAPSKIEAHGYGMTKPIASNSNYQGRSLNRRVEFKIFRDDPKNPTGQSLPNLEKSQKSNTENPNKLTPNSNDNMQLKMQIKKSRPKSNYQRPKKVVNDSSKNSNSNSNTKSQSLPNSEPEFQRPPQDNIFGED